MRQWLSARLIHTLKKTIFRCLKNYLMLLLK